MHERASTDRTERWRRVLVITWALVGLALIVAGLFWMLGRVATALTPFVLALIVVFLLRKPVARLERAGLKRSPAVGVCYLASAAVLVVIGLFIVPPIVAEVRDFVEEFPGYYDAALELWSQVEEEYLAVELPPWITEAIESSRESLVSWGTELSRNLARGVVNVGGQIFGFFVNIFLALALAYFVLRDLPTLKSEIVSLPGRNRQDEVLGLLGEMNVVLEGFIRGQAIIATTVGVLTGLGLWILGVPYALVIGLIAGVTNLIPYLGPIVGGIIAAISAAFVSPQLVLLTIVWVVVVQQAESTFLQPRVMSDQVHMHPALVILSLLVGATLFGLIGMLFAVPVAAVLKVLFVHYFEKWTESPISSEDGALFRKPRNRSGRGQEQCEPPADACDDEVEAGEDGREAPGTGDRRTDR